MNKYILYGIFGTNDLCRLLCLSFRPSVRYYSELQSFFEALVIVLKMHNFDFLVQENVARFDISVNDLELLFEIVEGFDGGQSNLEIDHQFQTIWR